MRLRPNELCPVHKSVSCCGRELLPSRPRLIRLLVAAQLEKHLGQKKTENTERGRRAAQQHYRNLWFLEV